MACPAPAFYAGPRRVCRIVLTLELRRMKLRSFIFWSHLIAGVSAGMVILLMCVRRQRRAGSARVSNAA